MSLLLLAFASVLAQINAPPIPNCGIGDSKCLIQSAQYTVVGTVVSTTRNANNSGNYNATIAIRCVLSSFSSPPSNGNELVGNEFTVAQFGFPKRGCPANTGTNATVGETAIFLLYVARPQLRNTPVTSTIFTVQSICAGSLPFDTNNMQMISNAVNGFTENQIPAQNRGTDPACALPPPNAAPEKAFKGDYTDPDAASNSAATSWVSAVLSFIPLFWLI